MKQSNFIIELQYQYLNYITGIPVLYKIFKKIHNTGKKKYTSDRQVQEIPIDNIDNNVHGKMILEDIDEMCLSYWKFSLSLVYHFPELSQDYWGRRGRDHMVVGFTTIWVISAHHHKSCEFELCSWRGGVLRYNIM
jgi:hypothetical protein